MTGSDEHNPYRSPKYSNEESKADKPEATPQGMPGKLVVLSTFESSDEAHLFKNELENHGIRASVNNETTTAIFGASIGGQSSAFWIEVLVMEADAERALEIKADWNSDDADSDSPEIPEWTCQCGEVVDEGFALCWNCGGEYESTP